ncbi:MAG: hypothetical protein JGK17_30545 [Microcoleus sp. PH2017_10_PVI_O_A]|uniref:hypothetical protein n=1 Tax=unclassified Microcoleus TaxID=2642155 RepID=UPI001D638028|nr:MULTISPECIES: hypothetical protein [unclassified Microcoleus]TAE74062.1 MAG: hypothetical protein EAZ83_30875 [Oscillatoriales cyanobacterium]MCC3409809.1 hypothetical protein [Microcoleus sp. PH2017_10_PVI_O_A]MCC3464094.1 hypothetical protein [Microcoleus sp. PH2017_11_PCY_U_A]MCC3482407.1 hypothetical protein [Microcoleus sp. PH2017_12_PCY_D_A]MCC3530094.1 hypothetical protein [Microcoleus sp. PH2017_21_RUC_O_A]
MTALFRRICPSKKLRITARSIAQFLKISQNLIKRVESWAYVVFVHHHKGGQFISYRKLEEWQNAIAHHIQTCPTLRELTQLKTSIQYDTRKFKKQYLPKTLDFLVQMCVERQDILEIWESSSCIAS